MGKEFQRRPDGGRSLKDIIVVPCSFETGEQAAQRVYVPFKIRVTKIRGIVTKALAATDAGTVTAANASGSMTSGAMSFPLSSALNAEPTALAPSGANTVIAADSYVQLTAAKTTAGGKVLITIEYVRA